MSTRRAEHSGPKAGRRTEQEAPAPAKLAAQTNHEAMADGLESSGCPCVVLSHIGRVIYRTSTVRTYVGRDFLIIGGYLRATDAITDAAFRELTEWARSGADAKPARFLVRGAAGAAPLLAAPVAKIRDIASGGAATSIVAFVDFSHSPSPPINELGDLFGLTPSEATIAVKIAHGLTVSEIAKDRDVTVATIRSQLKSIFRKLDIKRQAEIVRIIDRMSRLSTSGREERP